VVAKRPDKLLGSSSSKKGSSEVSHLSLCSGRGGGSSTIGGGSFKRDGASPWLSLWQSSRTKRWAAAAARRAAAVAQFDRRLQGGGSSLHANSLGAGKVLGVCARLLLFVLAQVPKLFIS
jgi:hypothetical protein